ncbi:MAG: hypothetical protein ACLT8Y_02125 [Dorea formicigenerans]
MIMNDVESSIQYYIDHSDELIESPKSSEGSLPYFLWGRSAGAYLCLIAAAKGTYTQAPAGILSYYGYGFLCDNWFKEPSRHYCTLPKVPESALCVIPEGIHADGDLDTHYSVYVYARQQGNWIDLFTRDVKNFSIWIIHFALVTNFLAHCSVPTAPETPTYHLVNSQN